MTNRPPPRIAKWIFVAADLLMLAVFAWLVRYFLPPKTTWDYVIVLSLSCLWAYGAYICITPWLVEFKAQTRQIENETLADAMAQLQRLEDVGARVQTATATWQAAHDSAARVAQVAADVQQKIQSDMKDFMEFAERVNNEEKKHLGLEVEKLKRAEGDWLQVTARLLDHTFALNQAAHRSGQANVIAQLDNFQNACRDAVRRIGLSAFAPSPGDPFDSRGHQTEQPDAQIPEGALVTEILATGFTYQGQLLRRALVRVAPPEASQPQPAPVEESAPAPEAVEEVQTPVEPTPEYSEPSTEPTSLSSLESKPEPIAEPIPEPISKDEPIAHHEPAAEHRLAAEPPPVAERDPIANHTPVADHEPIAETRAKLVEAEPNGEFTLVAEPVISGEPRPRRRARKPDPQTDLPF